MLNMNRRDLIQAIENVHTDNKDKIEWNLEFIYVDACANRGHRHYGLATAYGLLAKAELNQRKRLAK